MGPFRIASSSGALAGGKKASPIRSSSVTLQRMPAPANGTAPGPPAISFSGGVLTLLLDSSRPGSESHRVGHAVILALHKAGLISVY
jgi:hypothetical protein